MRLDRILALCLLLPVAGCVTTRSDSSSLGQNMPKTSAAEEAVSAARIHTELGQRYLASGDLQTALEKLTKALQFDPGYAPAHTVIAVVYERIHQLPEAELHYRKAVALEPGKGGPANNLGQFLCSTGKYAEADTYFRKAVADPFNQSPDVALTNAGICHLRANDVAAAETNFRDAIARNPQNTEATFQLANTLYLHNDAFHARAFIQRLDALGQPSAAALKLGHDIEVRLGNREGAQNYSNRLRNQFPDSEQAHSVDNAATP
jgi:type IV pilus assembly protein PilF